MIVVQASSQPTSPWLSYFDPALVEAVHQLRFDQLLAWLNRQSVDRGLVTGFGQPLQFLPQAALPEGAAYESWIAETGCVPTRDNLHDRYNAMIWMSCPHTKASLNAVQARAIQRQQGASLRGAVRDAATLWDENLAVIVVRSDQEILQARLAAHDWQSLFIVLRDYWHDCWTVAPFGHALLEKLGSPYKAITAHVLIQPMQDFNWDSLDRQLAGRVHDDMTPKMFMPLPVMGLPGWDPHNVNPMFYVDSQVFRSPRSA